MEENYTSRRRRRRRKGIKINFALEQALNAQRESRCIVILFP
jgi:hypothetical protein